ncbi:pfkB family carbohydrate kinase domain-containing protein [Hirsutella rhossiliensis]|uniref:PfkB family carbohydrate kinase domain-containing protein n=1 Tax=Hirsutella rhossiliensis TaxID=111463 RepID=A0A9P8MZP7_9HYPO|nr:pfkB family carbohydrate kinase domain-containing protein [Hirsutella rhossiliensis]KAH0965008.1 pfkB family carbohydrate kinase domain-containing protein [Hirsutella rhossiliensis]
MQHLVLVGACYLDTILSVPHYPEQDSKLRATSLAIRRGGNCPNTLEVLEQLLDAHHHRDNVQAHLVSPLPERSSPATRRIVASFGPRSRADLDHCLYRDACSEPASSYIIRSEATGSRTIVNYNLLPEMTAREFEGVVRAFVSHPDSWWHFEGRIPDTTLACIRLLRSHLPAARISVELEKPGRQGLPELAAEADVVFYSRSWAESRGHQSAEACLTGEQRRQSTVGAGDTFIAGMLYGLVCREKTWHLSQSVRFAVDLATLKVQREGFQGLGADMVAPATG